MLRSRKKDLNLRPNRILDKKSSRGMLYENEELRLRTIHINEEVDKSHTNIKKLKKENEVLKREIWALRDECEKLEGMLKKITRAVEQNGGNLEVLGLVPLSSMKEESDENPGLAHHNLSRRMSRPEGFHRRSSALSGMSGISFYDSEDEELEDLQMIDEDGDSGSSEPQTVQVMPDVPCRLATPEGSLVQSPSVPSSLEDLMNSNTCASSPPSCSWQQFTSVSPELEVVKEESESNYNTNSNSHNSPIPVLPKSHNPTTDAPTIEITPAPARIGTSTTPSPELSKRGSKYIGHNSQCSIDGSQDRLSPIPLDADPSPLNIIQRRKSFSESQEGQVVMSSETQSNFPEFYRSEPNLFDLHNGEIPKFDLSDRRVSVTRRLSNASAKNGPKIQKTNENWSAVDKNVVIGYIDLVNGVAGAVPGTPGYVLRDLRPQEIIDELELQFDPTLQELVGVRMLGSGPTRIFISLRSALGVQKLLQTGLKLREGKVIVRLIDARKKCSLVVLAGLPPDLSDSTVISVLNQYGQVVSPLERRVYKGVDISERLARMHLIAKVPTHINIAGYEVPAKICHCQPLTQESDKEVLPPIDGPNQPKLHRLVTRTLSSAPRLEGQSMVSGNLGGLMGEGVTKSSSKLSLTSLSNPMKKQQTQRIPRSSPGSLTIPQSEDEGQTQNQVPTNKTFYRSFSFDPRRRSSTSRIGITTMTVQTTEPSGHQPLNNSYGNSGTGRPQLQNQISNHSSQLNPNEMNRRVFGERRKKESIKSLPWCGCWGNGLI